MCLPVCPSQGSAALSTPSLFGCAAVECKQPKGGRLKLLARGETVPEFDDIAFNGELGVVHGRSFNCCRIFDEAGDAVVSRLFLCRCGACLVICS